jgi:hypothetical protein
MAGKTRHVKARNFSGWRPFSFGTVWDRWLLANQPSRRREMCHVQVSDAHRVNVCSSGSLRRAPATSCPLPRSIAEVMAQFGALHWSRPRECYKVPSHPEPISPILSLQSRNEFRDGKANPGLVVARTLGILRCHWTPTAQMCFFGLRIRAEVLYEAVSVYPPSL